MVPPTKTFYRYRSFSTNTLDSLCHDSLHFAHPSTFNDPLDCKPTLECDSSLEQLRELQAQLFEKRVLAEVTGASGPRPSSKRFFTKKNRLRTSLIVAFYRAKPGDGATKEWRLIGSQGLQESPLLLKEVTFGLRCPTSVKHTVVQALAGRHKPVRFYEISEVPNRFSLRREKVYPDDLARFLPHVAESGAEIFGLGFEDESA